MFIYRKYSTWLLCSLLGLVYTQVPPKLAPLPRELEFKRGERFQLVCSCREGEPPLTFSWVRDGQTLVESIEVQVRRFDEFSSSITISALREDHAGNYTCIVSNQGGSDSSTVKLRVLVAPTWLRQPYDMSVLSGARVTLNCETAGIPKPTVTWRRSKGFNLQQMETLTVTHWRTGEDGSLTTSSAKKEDEGFYSCEVANGVGEGLRKTVRIEVQVPPSVTVMEAEKTVKKGDSTTLRCDVTGDIPLTITWGKANKNLPLISEDRIRFQEDSTLENSSSSVIIRNTAAEDTGLYICSARNTFGQSQATIRLKVVEQPSTPLDFRVSEIWCKSVRLRWKEPYNGNSPLTNYIIRYKVKDSKTKPTETKVPDSQSFVIIRDLRPRFTYSFQVLAVNEVGASGASSTVHATTREEEPEAAPTNVHVKSKDSAGFLLSWKAPPVEKWNGDLIGFSIGYKRVSHGSTQSLPFTYKVLPVFLSLSNPGLEASASREYHVRGLQESSSYTVVVQAMTRAGFGPPSEPVLVKTSYGESPQVPTISLISTEQTVITLRIEPTGRKKTAPTQYTLHIREGSSHWLKIPLTPHNKEYKVGGLLAGGQYKLYVTARNNYGDSGPSEVVTFRTDPESTSSSMFQYEEEDLAIPFYQKLSFIIPVAVSMTIIFVVPIAACCCLRKLNSLQAPRPGVESRGFTYTASGSAECTSGSAPRPRSLPPQPAPSSSSSSGHYSTLQNYGSVIPANDPRFSHFMLENKLASQVVNLPSKHPNC
ncbi:Down syndrome cell adhesion molecule-like protein Dscam2 isoform X2 [Stegodyphus dumicola]|uniref:Down syndrome cell adhesion molecule-like protein Dscam2 isoform X2 n=1 Tax=Stegodyphus dumicola TaxID=202533 RepID=UPI0015A76D8A|nr:Down syndrome cell adhesion molecule-like protein Dscam2 isoform X2 [Stegodyphus dumicola]